MIANAKLSIWRAVLDGGVGLGNQWSQFIPELSCANRGGRGASFDEATGRKWAPGLQRVRPGDGLALTQPVSLLDAKRLLLLCCQPIQEPSVQRVQFLVSILEQFRRCFGGLCERIASLRWEIEICGDLFLVGPASAEHAVQSMDGSAVVCREVHRFVHVSPAGAKALEASIPALR